MYRFWLKSFYKNLRSALKVHLISNMKILGQFLFGFKLCYNINDPIIKELCHLELISTIKGNNSRLIGLIL